MPRGPVKAVSNRSGGGSCFTGVIFTIWFNARAARRQKADERDHERETLRVALAEELTIIHESLSRNADQVEAKASAKPDGAFWIPADRMDDAYRAFVPKVGMLAKDEVRTTMFAYLTLRTYHAKLRLIGEVTPAGDHVRVLASRGAELAAMMREVMPKIASALSALRAGGT